MKTLNHVIAAVEAGTDASEDELRYAVRMLSVLQALDHGTLVVLSGGKGSTRLSFPDHQRVRMAFDAWTAWKDRDLDEMRGKVFEPGISAEERKRRQDEELHRMIADGNTVLGLDREIEEP